MGSMSPAEAAAPRLHAGPPAASPEVPEPSHAERVRTLLSLGSVGTVSTLSRRRAGFPFGSLMPYALDALGRPLFLISSMAMHTQNLRADARASLFVAEAAAADNLLGSARATLVGLAEPVGASEAAQAREHYLARHEGSRYWVDFVDFSFFRLEPEDVYYVGGFGTMGWVEAEAYRAAAPDPLAAASGGILAHMNADHVPAMLLLARVYAGMDASEAAMTSVDRLGFSLRLKTADGIKGTRIAFTREVASAGETRTVLVDMVRAAEKAAP